jgi:hypothetical protein
MTLPTTSQPFEIPLLEGNPVPVIRELFKNELENENYHSLNNDSQWPGTMVRDLFRAVQAYWDRNPSRGDAILAELWEDHVSKDIRYLDPDDDPVSNEARLRWYSGV